MLWELHACYPLPLSQDSAIGGSLLPWSGWFARSRGRTLSSPHRRDFAVRGTRCEGYVMGQRERKHTFDQHCCVFLSRHPRVVADACELGRRLCNNTAVLLLTRPEFCKIRIAPTCCPTAEGRASQTQATGRLEATKDKLKAVITPICHVYCVPREETKCIAATEFVPPRMFLYFVGNHPPQRVPLTCRRRRLFGVKCTCPGDISWRRRLSTEAARREENSRSCRSEQLDHGV